jgi:EcsC protein family
MPEHKAASLQAMRELQAAISAKRADSDLPQRPIDDAIRHKAFDIAHHDFSREITRQLVEVRILTSIPGIGGIVGLIVDTRYMGSVGRAARHAYQMRWLAERGRLPEALAPA